MPLDTACLRFAQYLLLDALVILFLMSGAAKLLDLSTFRFGLQLLPFMTAGVAAFAAVAVPVAELFLAVFLFLNVTAAKYAAIGMLTLFSGVALVAVGMGRKVPCGCFGQLDGQTLSFATVLRNGILIFMALSVLGLQDRTEWLLPLWQSGLCLLAGLSLVRLYKNHRLILALRKAKLL
jgi:hypothetical protein